MCSCRREVFSPRTPQTILARIPCQFFPGCMQTRGPTTQRECPSEDHAPLGMTVGCWAAELRSAGRGAAVPPYLSQRFGCGWFGIGQQGPGFAVFFVTAYDFTVWVRIEREAVWRAKASTGMMYHTSREMT